MSTNIYTSRKLEKVIPSSLIKKEKNKSINLILGKWNANIFYVSHKKCLIVTNSLAKYTVLLDRLIVSDIPKLSEIFTKTLYDQLLVDDMKIDFSKLQKIVGQVDIYPTDNDKKIIGIQNSLKYHIVNWKHEFGHIDNWSFRRQNGILNEIPYQQMEWLSPKEKMKEILQNILL